MPKIDGRRNNGGHRGTGPKPKGNTERITLRLPPDLKTDIERTAQKNGRSMNDEIVERLR